MYEKFFNLKVKPFDLVPNPDFLFLSSGHKKALTYLKYGISENIGFILMTGEVGSGKTTIIRDLVKNLNGNVTLSKVFNTKVTSEQLISLVNEDFGLEVKGKEKVGMLRELNDFLIDQHAKRRQSMLIVDEAQNLSAELLEEIRMLSNLETNMSKLLQIVLVGQPELRKTLSNPQLRQLRQRISISCHLQPLTRNETEEYIMHRLERAGGRDAATFEEGTMDLVFEFTRGVPRLINILCDFLLLTAFSEKSKDITLAMTKEIVKELERENRFWQDEEPAGDQPPRDLGEVSERLKGLEEKITSRDGRTADSQSFLAKDTRSEIRRLSAQLWELEVKVRNMAVDLYDLKRKFPHFEVPRKLIR